MATIKTPLFWDLHLHGVAGIDFMHATEDAAVHACENLGRNGIGYFAPTLLTAEPALLADACMRWGVTLERAREKNWLPKGAAVPVGLHLEGPFLNPQMAGAHPKNNLHLPDWSLAEKLISAACGHVAIVTLAPELPGALELIRKLTKKGVRVQIGHTMATSAEALAACKAGACGVTHLYNAMRVHHRSPGVLAPLRQGLLTAEIITDDVHLDREFVQWNLRAAPDHLYAVSDGCSAVGARKNAQLTLGSLALKREGAAAIVAASGTLAGGATYLTEHPARILKGLPAREQKQLFSIFHATQARLFKSLAKRNGGTNHFDAKTLKFVSRVGA